MEPYRIKVVEPLATTTRAQREAALQRVHYNLFDLHADEVTIDLLTDSGTGAVSAAQLAAAMHSDESYANARSFHRFHAEAQSLTGFPIILPVHQGRAAERILLSTLVRPGQVTLSNTHFDTCRANVELAGGQASDIPCREAADLDGPYPFKGNIDLQELSSWLTGPERDQVALVLMTITNNGGGGQPVSMENLKKAAAICRDHSIPFFLDAARFAENAWLVTQREPDYRHRSPRSVAEEAFRLADGCMISLKKDGIVNIGGLLALRDRQLAERCELQLIATEGFPTYGGLAGRDLEMIAQGIQEATQPEYLNARADMTAYIAELARAAGISVVEPPGIHAVYLNAGRLLPHIPPHHFPGHALACELYLEGGIRSVECGSLYLGTEDTEGRPLTAAPFELVRLAIPRRVYTQSHFEYVGQVFRQITKRADHLPGYRITRTSPLLRHFKAKLEPIICDRSASTPP
jgi:tryptophanase